jgi:hypothetical protein
VAPTSSILAVVSASTIRVQIAAAFDRVPRPRPENIAPHTCCECEALAADLAPFASDAVPEYVLRPHVWDLPLLSAEAKHYYLPAWLYAALNDPGCDFSEAVIMDIDSNHRVPSDGYTSEQWQAILNWLDFVRSSPGNR